MASDAQNASPRVSVVVPVGRLTTGLGSVIREYGSSLARLDGEYELRLVGDTTSAALRVGLAAELPWVLTVDAPGSGWGTMVRAGLESATGEILCFLSWPRTSGPTLARVLSYALSNRDLVLRANRRTRDTPLRRVGSLLFNLECRALLGTTSWDVNGTPKAFWRHRAELLALRRDDDLIDAEFCLVCHEHQFPVVEVPVDAVHGGVRHAGPNLVDAMRMYVGVFGLRRGAAG